MLRLEPLTLGLHESIYGTFRFGERVEKAQTSLNLILSNDLQTGVKTRTREATQFILRHFLTLDSNSDLSSCTYLANYSTDKLAET